MVAALVVSVISFQMNGTMLTPAIHAINEEFGDNAYGSISTFFALAGAVSCIVLIHWSDYVGRKRVLLGITAVLCIGTVLCIVATSLEILVLGRILQGAANITFGLAFLILREHLSLAAFGTCCGVITSINGGVAGVDTLLAGVMVDQFGFRSIFVLSLVLGVCGILFAWKSIPADPAGRTASGRMDWWGAGLLALAITGIDLFVRTGATDGYFSTAALAWIGTGIAALVAFVVVDSRIPHPLLAIEHMRSRETWPLIAATILCMGSLMLAVIYIVPALAEDTDAGFATTATMTALLFVAPAAVIQVLSAPIAGRFGARIGFVTVLRAGIVSALALVALLAMFAQQRERGDRTDIPTRSHLHGYGAHHSRCARCRAITRRRTRGAARDQQCQFRHRHFTRIRLGRTGCRRGHRCELRAGVVGMRCHRSHCHGLQLHPEAQAGCPGISLRRHTITLMAPPNNRRRPSRR